MLAPPPPLHSSSSSRFPRSRPAASRWPKIPGYTIERELGRGSYGVVFLARSESDGAKRALKVLTDSRGFDDARFELEHAVLRKLHHPGLVQVYEKGRYGQVHYYAMDYCPGPTLKEQAGKRTYSPRQAALLVAQLAEAAGYAHARGVVHRDLKPANVILAPGGPRIMDFGLVRAPDMANSLTLSGEMIGTPLYMAPEVWEGHRPITARADVYGLGVILYECMVGQLPFQGRTVVELAPKVLTGSPFPPSDFVDLPSDLEAVCLRALARDPEERYADGSELAGALRRCARSVRPTAEPPAQQRGLLKLLLAVAIPALLTSLYAATLFAGSDATAESSDPGRLPPTPAQAAAEPTPLSAALSPAELLERARELARTSTDLAAVRQAFVDAAAANELDRTQIHVEHLALLVRRRQRVEALRVAETRPVLEQASPLLRQAEWLEAEALAIADAGLTPAEGERLGDLLTGLLDDPNWGAVAKARLLGLANADPQSLAAAYAALEHAKPWGEALHAQRVLLGSVFNSAQRYSEAEAMLRAALDVHPDDTGALMLLAFVIRNRNRATSAGNREAADLYTRLIAFSEPNPPRMVLNYNARLLCELEAFEAAADCARRRLQLGADIRASFWLGVACVELGLEEEARAAIRAAFANGEAALSFEFDVLNAKLPGRAPKIYSLLND